MTVSISIDGERKMTARVQDIATRFEQAALRGYQRVWCGLQQLDIKEQAFFVFLMDEKFYSSLTLLTAHSNRQQILTKDMKTKASTVSDSRKGSMSKMAS